MAGENLSFEDSFRMWMDTVFERKDAPVLEKVFNVMGKALFHVRLPMTEISIGMMLPKGFGDRLAKGEWGKSWYASSIYIPKGIFTCPIWDDIDGTRATYDPVHGDYISFKLTELTEEFTFLIIVVGMVSKTSQMTSKFIMTLLRSAMLKDRNNDSLDFGQWASKFRTQMPQLGSLSDVAIPSFGNMPGYGTMESTKEVPIPTDIRLDTILNNVIGINQAIAKRKSPLKVFKRGKIYE